MLLDLHHYSIVKKSPNLPLSQGYHWAGNGIFRSATRTEFRATLLYHPVNTPGLARLIPQFELLVSPVSQAQVEAIVKRIRQFPNLEQLFYLYWRGDRWEILVPEQECTARSCLCLDTHPEPAAIEIHSHGLSGAFFSPTDDREETGFRISTVFGKADKELEVISRVCVHGLFLNLDSSQIYQDINRYVTPF